MQNHKDQFSEIPNGLSAIAGNRDLITTDEFAEALNVASQTVRKNYCLTGEAYGIKPIKIGNRLLWGVEQIAKKLKGNK
ncbi:helix-turn-helix domain-containing protein [Polynucleobacter paneuropaeus]|nr:helix-turn-helix domain-containing protein [Polynucleobacter paneuropaeus]